MMSIAVAANPRKLIVFLKNLYGAEFPIQVYLPLNMEAVRRECKRPENGYLLCYSEVDVMDFLSSIAYLPETDAQLKRADDLYKTGVDWHTACERSKVIVCAECGSTRQSVHRDAELMAEAQGFPVPEPFCCETIVA